MAFTFIPNIAIATYAAAMFEMKTRLIAAGWSIQDSGDGETTPGALNGSYGGGGDVIATHSISASFVNGNIANYKSWWRIRSPLGVGGPELLFYHGASGMGSDLFGVLLIPACGVVGLWSGANCANYGAPPTSTVVVPFGNSNNGTNLIQDQYATGFDSDASTARRMDFAFGDASEGYAFYAFTRTAARRYYRGFALDYIKTGDIAPGDVGKHVLWWLGGTNEWLTHLGTARTTWGAYSGQNPGGGNASNPTQCATTEGDPFVDEPVLQRRGRVSHCILDPLTFAGAGNQGTDLGLSPYNSQVDVWRGSCWYYRSNYPEDFTTRGAPRFAGVKGKSTLFHHGGGGATDCALATGENLVAMGSGRVFIVADSATALLDPAGTTITAAIAVNMYTYMDVTYNNMTVEVVWERTDIDSTAYSAPDDPFAGKLEPSFGPYEVFMNRVWDTAATKHVSWQTEAIDSIGEYYPGPGVFGVDTSDFVVERYSVVR